MFYEVLDKYIEMSVRMGHDAIIDLCFIFFQKYYEIKRKSENMLYFVLYFLGEHLFGQVILW